MKYTSTRNSTISITASEAIVKGISDEGGLFVPFAPKGLPKFTMNEIQDMADKPYHERAFDVLSKFLDFDESELRGCVSEAYNMNFRTLGATRLVGLDNAAYMLELWHGPTAAFKDMALQILPGLIKTSIKKVGKSKKILILTATSGDTGKAALEGFKDVEGIEIVVFYPEDGVSDVQKRQMTTQEGENVHVFAVKGNFDDCQNAVKAVFADASVIKEAEKAEIAFSSANSINWGRLCPQIAYYISAYADLVAKKAILPGDKINICVPTGNFGNILAAYYAMEMGLPVEKFICASNTNNVLTDFINTGVYSCKRDFHTTVSPSMDILVSSNLERLLYHISGNNDGLVNGWFTALSKKGEFEADKKVKTKMKSLFYGGWCSEEETLETIKSVYNEHGYLMDTHTAVGYKVWQDYMSKSGGGKPSNAGTKTIIASTASPYKFETAVYEALYGKYSVPEIEEEDDFANGEPKAVLNTLTKELEAKTGIPIPKPLVGIDEKPIRFTQTLTKAQIKNAVLKILE